MTYILDRKLNNGIPSPFLIACEGFGDVSLIDVLLRQNQITNCRVGCPSRDSVGGEGKDKLPKYLAAVQAALRNRGQALTGILVVVDADTSRAAAFGAANAALEYGEFPMAPQPFTIYNLAVRVAVYLVPGEGRDGTLEHLLLEAAYGKNPKAAACIDRFLACINKKSCFDKPVYSANQHAKMRMSSLVGASCKDNPWGSAAVIWSSEGNPVPKDSPAFSPLVDFLRQFSQ
jgi:hypothetical protein